MYDRGDYNSSFALRAVELIRVAILMITNVTPQIANRIQKPPSGAGFFEVVKKCRMVIRKISR